MSRSLHLPIIRVYSRKLYGVVSNHINQYTGVFWREFDIDGSIFLSLCDYLKGSNYLVNLIFTQRPVPNGIEVANERVVEINHALRNLDIVVLVFDYEVYDACNGCSCYYNYCTDNELVLLNETQQLACAFLYFFYRYFFQMGYNMSCGISDNTTIPK